MEILKTLTTSTWQSDLPTPIQTELTESLESGQVLYLPKLSFQLAKNETELLTPNYISPKSKNISFNKLTSEIRGLAKDAPQIKSTLLHSLLARYADHAQQLINTLMPHYNKALIIGRTSFRPVEVSGRETSYRKDDSRLHVDAFPANPNHGMRILRVFCNINPKGQARVWRLGEPFMDVAKQFLPRLKKPVPGSSALLNLLNITKRQKNPI